ncbi:helix-turn-helix transcriptional regulator [Caloranaerobacter azorensis]|uniref:CBS domain-containing protein n=2 Tax=Caloranaerobacter azorensis TaxID=116090 RepID=A0A1M5SAP2_9FIRM|nr:helix-turn-helix transcriptional regulator [Caloranaerobacter azorensis]QIB26296.1 helix-turn-helix transcriptional regulator [Caloranaerobacter azorensis]SHH34983.1 CBS domain-containing protein [Caloranaerobacter azorensis DSM 13643]
MSVIQYTERQNQIINIVKKNQPITSEAIAKKLNLTRATLRPDLAILTMSGILEARPKVGYFYSGKSNLDFYKDYIKEIKVDDIKSLPVVVDESTTVYDAIVTLFLEDVGTVCVVSKGLLVGVVSRKDFLKSAIGGVDINKIPVGVIMTRMPNIIVAKPEESIIEAAEKIIEHQVDSLPVVQDAEVDGVKGYKVVGRISKTNITKIFVDLGTKASI